MGINKLGREKEGKVKMGVEGVGRAGDACKLRSSLSAAPVKTGFWGRKSPIGWSGSREHLKT